MNITLYNKCFDASFGYRQKPSQSTSVIQDEKSETKIAHCETNAVALHNEGTFDQIKDHSRFYKGE